MGRKVVLGVTFAFCEEWDAVPEARNAALVGACVDEQHDASCTNACLDLQCTQ